MENRTHKLICEECKGNGFIYTNVPSYSEVRQCKSCHSQGEIVVIEPSIEEMNSILNPS
jgi:DnaJ-class molecular chaperone|tara:strand:- start:305 stop:481 length:177 start_codon:yes stop_codon:yes gene_type:complete